MQTDEDSLLLQEEPHVSPEPGEIVEEEPKKKKLNLEEYRNRRKNVKPKSPIKRTWNILGAPSNSSGTGSYFSWFHIRKRWLLGEGGLVF